MEKENWVTLRGKFNDMKKYVFVGVSALMATVSVSQSPPNVGTDPAWGLLWQDNFTGTSVNPTLWLVRDNFDHWGADNVVFIDDNVSVSGGNLIITFKKENYTCPAPAGQPGDDEACVRQALGGGSLQYNHTSGYIVSQPNYNFQYGYIESRIKLDHAYALFPAFWTSSPYGYAGINASEIDIFEMKMASLSSSWMTSNIHYDYTVQNPADGYLESNIGNYDDTYRIFSIEWDPEKIRWFVDGVHVRTYPNGPQHEIKDMVMMIYDIGIEWGFSPNGSTPSSVNMLVDYIRVYQKFCNPDEVVNVTTFPFSTYVQDEKKSIRIGGTNTQPGSTSLLLWATDFVLFDGTFTVPVGSTLEIDMDGCY